MPLARSSRLLADADTAGTASRYAIDDLLSAMSFYHLMPPVMPFPHFGASSTDYLRNAYYVTLRHRSQRHGPPPQMFDGHVFPNMASARVIVSAAITGFGFASLSKAENK